MLNLSKKYRTRCGYAVRNLQISHPAAIYPIQGEYEYSKGCWTQAIWSLTGAFNIGMHGEKDLIEIKEETMSTIDLSKEYTTRDGRPVELWKIEDTRVFGTYKPHDKNLSYMCIWDKTGHSVGISYPSPLDLIEKKRVHKKTYYFGISSSGIRVWDNEEHFNNYKWLGTKKIEVEITEGEFI
jgi:hypothetical protein